MATTREQLKQYFRKYALPTEEQFAELIDAFVHKDEDMLTQSKIDGLVEALESKVSTDTLDSFKEEIQSQINSGGITVDSSLDSSSTNPVENQAVYAALEDKADKTDLDNYWKKDELQIDSSLDSSSTNPVENQAVYAALENKADKTDYWSKDELQIDSSLDSSSPNPVENQAVYAALEDKANSSIVTDLAGRVDTAEDNIAGHGIRIGDLEEFKETVRAFMEDSDSSDETINRWHEIENFLQGITDTETLTGLLQDLKAEILAEVPVTSGGETSGNYVKQIEDLDSYEGESGEIVQYIGQTDSNYTRGFFYEKRADSSSSSDAWNLRPAQGAEIIDTVDYNVYNGKIKYPPVNTTHFSTANQYRVYDLVDGRELFLANQYGQADWAVIFDSDNTYTEYYADRTIGSATLTWQVIPVSPAVDA